MKPIQKALLARGLDQASAATLAKHGWTLERIASSSAEDIGSLGLDSARLKRLVGSNRPPIPTKTLMGVLFSNRFQCCICRDPKQPVIIHHIDDWANSRSHDAGNLAVLCLHHHDLAHSKKSLSQNLTPAAIRDLKKQWESTVKHLDAELLLSAMRLEYSNWNYINELRLFELSRELQIDHRSNYYFDKAHYAGIIDQDGIPLPFAGWHLLYKYQGPNIIQRYLYISFLLQAVINKIQIINISDHLDRGLLRAAVAPGDFLYVQGAHVFSPQTRKRNGTGPGQIYEGVRRANGVEIRYVFDRWEATSSSAKTCWLSGTKNQGSLIQAKDISREDGTLIIRGTVIAICSNLGQLKNRDYTNGLF